MSLDIFLTNNLTNKKEKFIPKDKNNVRMYVCGPTVYDHPHIGNARPVVVFDILFKILKNKYPNVYYTEDRLLWHKLASKGAFYSIKHKLFRTRMPIKLSLIHI